MLADDQCYQTNDCNQNFKKEKYCGTKKDRTVEVRRATADATDPWRATQTRYYEPVQI